MGISDACLGRVLQLTIQAGESVADRFSPSSLPGRTCSGYEPWLRIGLSPPRLWLSQASQNLHTNYTLLPYRLPAATL